MPDMQHKPYKGWDRGECDTGKTPKGVSHARIDNAYAAHPGHQLMTLTEMAIDKARQHQIDNAI